ncbi:aminotransferase class I/II-fold pyridoxal phosphate-dependent enzyme [Sulfitobacter sp.]|uniref:aminotransferase class I/II-fold pyridoxal phosphate-dependent enzyme n=1 Tax=Sulfitobacter sp. TaxID=1903071 RepID=UPI00300321BE
MLRALIAQSMGTQADRIIVGNESEDLIGALFRAVIRPNDQVVTIYPSFGLHEFSAQMFGATVTKVRFNEDWSFPLEGLRQALRSKPRALIFSSPSNPAGPAISETEFRQVIADTDPTTVICFDEAYVEFIEQSKRFDALKILDETKKFAILLRTFSKAYGLAGARVGYSIASDPQLIAALIKTRNPFGVNALAACAAAEAIGDLTHLKNTVALATRERKRVTAALISKGFKCAPSQTNFVFFDTGSSAKVFADELRSKGVLIKGWLEKPFDTWARVTVGTPDENDIFLNSL